MRKAIKVAGMTLIGLALIATAAIGAWVYVVNNVEEPDYELVRSEGDIEVRDYPELVVAEVTKSGGRREAVSAGFSPLAGYIFAKDRDGGSIPMTAPVTQTREKIAMTAPVTQTKTDGANGTDTWTIRFIMPAQYTLETLPRPAGSDVTLTTMPATRRAAIRFSGWATDATIADQEAKLRGWMMQNDLAPVGLPTMAYYNDPWTPGPLRRNEVLFDVAQSAN
ncbi:MAG: heme-binding protein [Pseudomonadota bacterium]